MRDTQPEQTGSTGTKELVIVVVIALIAAVGVTGTYWVHAKGAEQAGTVAVTPEPPVSTRTVASSPTGADVLHTDVYFDFKSARLRADAVRVLQETASVIERSSVWVVLVQGQADRRGPAEYNRVLAQRRAEAVKQFLVELGVPEASVKVVTIGQEGTLCDDLSPECQQLNRRVHLEIRKLRAAAAAPVRPTLADRDVLDGGARP